MDVPKSNTDKQIPWTKEAALLAPVIPPTFDKPLVHIFWGPGQKTGEDGAYESPNPNEWKNNSLLMIPQIVRFIYASKPSYGSDDFANDGSGGDPPPPGLWVYTNTIVWGIQPVLKPAYAGTRIPGTNPYVTTINPATGLYDFFEILGDDGLWHSTVFEAADIYGGITRDGNFDIVTRRVVVRKSDGTGDPLFIGPITDCPYFDLLVWRGITWRRHRVDTGFEIFVAGFQSFNPPGTNPTGSPRCSYTDYGGIPGTEHPLDDYMTILGNHGPCGP